MADIILSLLFLLLLLIDLMICEFVQLVCETVDLLGVKRLRDWKTENRAGRLENRKPRGKKDFLRALVTSDDGQTTHLEF